MFVNHHPTYYMRIIIKYVIMLEFDVISVYSVFSWMLNLAFQSKHILFFSHHLNVMWCTMSAGFGGSIEN